MESSNSDDAERVRPETRNPRPEIQNLTPETRNPRDDFAFSSFSTASSAFFTFTSINRGSTFALRLSNIDFCLAASPPLHLLLLPLLLFLLYSSLLSSEHGKYQTALAKFRP